MQAPHFDVSAYHSSTYGPATGYETGNAKLHYSCYPVDPDIGCYSGYSSPGVQTIPGYSCRNATMYTESPPFYYSPGMSDSHKTQNGEIEAETHCGNASEMTREQDNFLLKSHDSVVPENLNTMYGGNSSTIFNIPNNQHQNQYHHLLTRHQKHSSSFDYTLETLPTTKIIPDDANVFGNTSVKMESLKSESSYLNRHYEEKMNSVPRANSRNLQQDLKAPVNNNIASSNDQIACISTEHSESKLLRVKVSAESFQTKSVLDDKKVDEASGESKPTMSYIALIAKAILESEEKRLNLGSIYNWIESQYPFYKNKGQGWRNSVRHNLSLNDCFIKAGRCEDGKGNYWAIHPANIQDFMRGDFRQRRRSRRRGRKKDCDMSMYHVPNGYLPSPASSLSPGVTFNPAALSSIYSPYTEAERRAYRLDEALLRQSVNNPFVKWYQQGSSASGYGVSTSPPVCGSNIYPSPPSLQWPQPYGSGNAQNMYPALNSTFSR